MTPPSSPPGWSSCATAGATPSGNATGHLVESGYRLPFATGKVKVLAGEQSNSSVIVDDGDSAAPS